MKPSFRILTSATSAVLVLTLAGCGSGSGPDGADSRLEPGDVTATPIAQIAGTPEAGDEVLDITLDGTTVSPSAERRSLDVGHTVVFRINATKAGQLHVHSSPEKTVDFPAGESQIAVTFDIPGVIDVEDHDLGKLIVQFEVS